MATIKNAIVYRVRFGNVECMTRLGNTADLSTWSMYQEHAVKLTVTQARSTARKFNGHLDKGTPKQYGFSVS
jgi:hypothetical protein